MDVKDSVKDYYGKVLASQNDLKTSACCSAEDMPMAHKKILGMLDDEILEKFYGCGSPIPPGLGGCNVLDLGSGTGRDAYLCAKLVGENGKVIGIDMTDEQLDVANKYLGAMMERFEHASPNVAFHKGYIENLAAAGVEEGWADVVISNCVVNLSPDKPAVMREVFRALKPGGELYFSDVFADRRIPKDLREHEVLYGECLSGALYMEDFRRILFDLGIRDFRVVSSRPIAIEDEELEKLCGHIQFKSITIRAFKLDDLEDRCEDYGHIATYNGSCEDQPHTFILDDHHAFVRGKPEPVCGNTMSMLRNSRFGKYFSIIGNMNTHFGLFDCGPDAVQSDEDGGCC